ncbi:A24 family peptidase [Marinobacterium arenosum]|uniref:A24 family peptidase n=1 Tax=Marinobacterium arenosum TaxID=2862496 RepID=UPI001C95B106|nr:A24 family peptidase [Marinobacterium arenosum]MBY4675731.1 A24 family peptidase [Marinobacterium arenosum]
MMLAYLTYDLSTVLLLLILVVAVVADLRSHRIPNLLTLSAVVMGIGLQTYFLESRGLMAAVFGLMAGLVLFLPLYLKGAMGAGDVKLLAAIGCFVGPLAVLLAACFSLIAAVFYSLALMAVKGELFTTLRRYWTVFALRYYVPPGKSEVAAQRIPFAAAIAAGTLVQLWRSDDLIFYHLTSQVSFQLQAMGAMGAPL